MGAGSGRSGALKWPLKDRWDFSRKGCGEWAHSEQKDEHERSLGHLRCTYPHVLRYSEQAVRRYTGEVGVQVGGQSLKHVTASKSHGDTTVVSEQKWRLLKSSVKMDELL